MRKRSEYEPYIGQTWNTTDMKKFVIIDLMTQEDDAWVEYENAQSKERYNCRLEAFRARFTPQAD